MNKIAKTYPAPAVLLNNNQTLVQEHTSSVAAGNNELTFDDVYHHHDVKRQLMADQHYKCAYCERAKNGDYGDVEHFRPKKGYNSSLGQPIVKPGYYWLAYDRDNLLFSCTECNRTYKKNLFPLKDESQRDIQHQDISREEPLLINPAEENPGDYICFEQHIIKPNLIDGRESEKGQETIKVFQLNDRMDLVESRRRAWELYQKLILVKKVVDQSVAIGLLSQSDLPDIQEEIDKITSEESEFAGMFKFQVRPH